MRTTLITTAIAATAAIAASAAAQKTDPAKPPVLKDAPVVPATPTVPAAPTTRPAPKELTLFIGDKAPAFEPETWVKGEPVKSFAADKVYVVEFWATWCGPCIAAIPHLTELQKEHPQVTFIGMAASERTPKDGDDNRLSKVRDFVSTQGDKMGYRVAFTPERTIPDAWMGAAGQAGIPCTFIVGKTGLVEWIGHPMGMDEPLTQILAGEWDRDAARKKAKEAGEARRKAAEFRAATAKAQADGDWDTVFKLMDERLAANPADLGTQMEMFRLMVGKADRGPAGYALGEKIAAANADNAQLLNELAWFVVDDRSVKNRNLDFALRTAEQANAAEHGANAAILDTLARCWWEKGDKAKAISFQKKAVEAIGAGDPSAMAQEIRDTLKKYESGK